MGELGSQMNPAELAGMWNTAKNLTQNYSLAKEELQQQISHAQKFLDQFPQLGMKQGCGHLSL